MGTYRMLPIGRLLLDAENPRLDQVEGSQRATLHRLVMQQGEKVVTLAADITQRGLDPMANWLVMAAPSSADHFIVLEGNRRLAALRLLDNPDAAGDGLSASQVRRLREFGMDFRQRPITRVRAYVKDRQESDDWLERRHGGEQEGKGVVPWGATERARFAERRRGRRDLALQALDFVVRSGVLDADTLQRVVRRQGFAT